MRRAAGPCGPVAVAAAELRHGYFTERTAPASQRFAGAFPVSESFQTAPLYADG